MTTTAKQRYEVEWCSSIPSDAYGDADMDNAVYERANFRQFEDAKLFAWNVLKNGAGKLPWDIVTIERQTADVDEDMLEHEGIRRLAWTTHDRWEITEEGEEPIPIN